jgi:SAM-dependent methyltransferase
MPSDARRESNAILRDWCAPITGDVLSLGSSTDSDGEGRVYRDYFPLASRYRTSEPTTYPGCDLVVDIRHMPEIETASVDCVFCSGVLEHVGDVRAAVGECRRVLRAGGVFLVGVPFYQPVHRAPEDFWRFTEYGVRYLLSAFIIRDLRTIGDQKMPSAYWVQAVK